MTRIIVTGFIAVSIELLPKLTTFTVYDKTVNMQLEVSTC